MAFCSLHIHGSDNDGSESHLSGSKTLVFLDQTFPSHFSAYSYVECLEKKVDKMDKLLRGVRNISCPCHLPL